MLGSLIDLIGGWRTVRARGGFVYEESRSGKRRIVPIEGWRKPGLRDERWLGTGRFADDEIVKQYGHFHVSEHHLRRRPREHAPA